MTGLNLMDKTLVVEGVKISLTIWDVGGMYIDQLKPFFYIFNLWYL